MLKMKRKCLGCSYFWGHWGHQKEADESKIGNLGLIFFLNIHFYHYLQLLYELSPKYVLVPAPVFFAKYLNNINIIEDICKFKQYVYFDSSQLKLSQTLTLVIISYSGFSPANQQKQKHYTVRPNIVFYSHIITLAWCDCKKYVNMVDAFNLSNYDWMSRGPIYHKMQQMLFPPYD